MSPQSKVVEPALERQGRRLGRTGAWWVAVAAVLCLPGIVLFVVGLAAGIRWMWPVGLAVIAIGGGPGIVGGSLLVSAWVARRSARHKLYA